MATSIGQIAAELARTNPWWRNSTSWTTNDPDLRQVSDRDLGYASSCLDGLEPGCLYLLRGPRRVGKTVAVKQAVERLLSGGVPPTSIIRVAADGWSANDLRTVAPNTALPPIPRDTPRWWFLDEVTAVTGEWAQQIKWLRDNDPGFSEATIVLTGSNAAQLTSAAGVLAGRRGLGTTPSDRTLLPIGFKTFARLLNSDLPHLSLRLSQLRSHQATAAYTQLVPWLDSLTRLWAIYLNYGGYPVSVAAARDGVPIPPSFIDDVFNVVFKDAFGTSHLSTTTTTALAERLMMGMASPLNVRSVADDLGLGHETVRRHVGYLADAYLVWHCPQKSEKSWTPREKSQSKLYAIDPLVGRLAHLRNVERIDIDATVLSEMQTGMAVHRSAHSAGTPWADEAFLFYARTPTRKEIDFVSDHLGGVALEGKYTDSGKWAGEAATLNASIWNGILTTRSVLDVSSDDAWAVPASLLCYLIDS